MTVPEKSIIYIPENAVTSESGYLTLNGIVDLLRPCKSNPDAVQFMLICWKSRG